MLWLLEGVERLEESDVLPVLARISPEHAERISALRVPAARVQSALAVLLLRLALRQAHGLSDFPVIRRGERGKPYFPDCPEIRFNLSHCKTAVACAVDASALGVDVQDFRPLRRPACPIAASQCLPLEGKVSAPDALTDEVVPEESKIPPIYRVLSEPERIWVAAGETASEQDRRFVRVWTCKEAWGKALGVGLDYGFRDTVFLPSAEPWTQDGFTFTHWDRPASALTVCAAHTMELRTVLVNQLLTQTNGGD